MKSYWNPKTQQIVRGTTILQDILESPRKTTKLLEVLNKFGVAINSLAQLRDKKTPWIIKQA